ncbi:hypothetical protein EVAR_39220_1 [Eumeta japonica]|uniref:Uncharacterized protein n=1 Tax=Eumeta variegata TaxID=151549 RepID=A0A4C1VNK4_EUMVA|nr:hypothetical protein EVAR_39220_1 [Eumeta japonica]
MDVGGTETRNFETRTPAEGVGLVRAPARALRHTREHLHFHHGLLKINRILNRDNECSHRRPGACGTGPYISFLSDPDEPYAMRPARASCL